MQSADPKKGNCQRLHELYVRFSDFFFVNMKKHLEAAIMDAI